MADADGNSDKPKGDFSGLALIEKASEFQWMIQITTFALFLDAALLIVKNKNLITFPWNQIVWSSEIGSIAVALIIFSVLMAAIIPIAEVAVVALVLQMQLSLTPYFRTKNNYRSSNGMVSTWDLKRLADEEKCNYLLAKCNDADNNSKKRIEDFALLSSKIFKFLFMLTFNFYITSEKNQSTIQLLTQMLKYDDYLLAIAICYLALGSICIKSWTIDKYPSVRVYYLPLYQSQQNEKAEREAKQKLYNIPHNRN
ncbi:hypothetical protein [Pseudomonas sp.]|uniref:hypothetical protein n=1 Tax=Pseudomonas sp. TaxID=306 RepID=UPI002622C112|nr:hypothetical protein [Pseudomonas sp.]